MHTLHFKDILGGQLYHELLNKMHVKNLKEAFQQETVSDILLLLGLFIMVLFIIKTLLGLGLSHCNINGQRRTRRLQELLE